MKKRQRTYSGTRETAPSQRELYNRGIALKAAREGMVLLKNEGVLPLPENAKVALYGGGAACTIKGGTGSGDVNERESVSIYQGFCAEGISLTNKKWLESYQQIYRQAREDWKKTILREMEEKGEGNLLDVYSAHVFHMPEGDPIEAEDLKEAQSVFYVISRTAGEAADRFAQPGDYYLTEKEKEELQFLSGCCDRLIVVLNTGGPIDLKEIQKLPSLKGLITIGQPGMEGGRALAQLVTGKAVPSGKLTDTWAISYEDYPNSATFSHNNQNTDQELYGEGIYVGYRYFDTFEKEVSYPFGYGLSYTDFTIALKEIKGETGQVCLKVAVKNQGTVWAGKEVVQVYVSCPQDGLEKERRRLGAFAKTKELAPGEEQELTLRLEQKTMASYQEEESSWVLQEGAYGIWIGSSLGALTLWAAVTVKETVCLEKRRAICGRKEELRELHRPEERARAFEEQWKKEAEKKGLPVVVLVPEQKEQERVSSDAWDQAEAEAKELAEKLTEEELISMVIGEVSKGQGQALGAGGIMVPGAAGETSSALEESWGVPGVSMADGPAGLRLMQSYEVDGETGAIYSQGILGALEGGFFADHRPHPGAQVYHQYCTAIPVGTVLAQTWNTSLLREVGEAVASELREFGVSWWLAPGMNIHRNPLCGRNFEYYSEDPLLSGEMAAAITRGVQSLPGVGTTIKHFACNNQEDNRMGCDSILSERALREIYLRGFEIAVKKAQPMAIMTSYNLINGVHTANSRDLCTVAAREEWGFRGIIMTDWTTTDQGGSLPYQCIQAGNDLIMPGSAYDRESIQAALKEGTLSLEELRACVKRLLTIIFQTLAFEGAKSYGDLLP